MALMNRIAAAEDELSSEEEFYEAQKEREIIERQAEIEKYKSYIHEKRYLCRLKANLITSMDLNLTV